MFFFVYGYCQDMMRKRTLDIQDAHVVLQTQPQCLGLCLHKWSGTQTLHVPIDLCVGFIVCLFTTTVKSLLTVAG